MLTTRTADRQESATLAAAEYASPFGQPQQRRRAARVTRAGDLALACALIAFTFPLLAIVALAIKLESPGPVFSRHERLGPGGRRVRVLKVRTTRHEADRGRTVWLLDSQVTQVGRFLRYTGIEELPQLLNVLRGEMTLLGTGQQRPTFLTGW